VWRSVAARAMKFEVAIARLSAVAILYCIAGLTGQLAYSQSAVANAAAHPVTMEDERAITAVLLRYATGIDRRDWPLFATCFTEDVVADYGDLGKWQGRGALVEHMSKGHAKVGPTMHKITNIVVTGDADHASATSYVDALLLPLTPGGAVRRAQGRYEDQLVRVGNAWKIANRRFISMYMTDSAS
jgi:ketosteroid isomerase-like protein